MIDGWWVVSRDARTVTIEPWSDRLRERMRGAGRRYSLQRGFRVADELQDEGYNVVRGKAP